MWAFWDPNPQFDDDFGTASVLTDVSDPTPKGGACFVSPKLSSEES
jgi:hypothetical protein